MYIGADPELFITTPDGAFVEGKEALKSVSINDEITPDGVQVELHPRPQHCAALFGTNINGLLLRLNRQLKASNLKVAQQTTVSIPPEQLRKMSKEARKLGCMPSKNLYDSSATVKVSRGFTGRSCGGHLHFSNLPAAAGSNEEAVKKLDYIVGNFSVMVDPDAGAAERRKVYGRAGEYRDKPYGFEYRTLSNFWLRAFPLTSMVFQMSREALFMPAPTWKQLQEAVPAESITTAINEANRDLALENFTKLQPLISNADDSVLSVAQVSDSFPTGAIPDIKFFLSKPLSHWFPLGIMEEWTKYPIKQWRAPTRIEMATVENQFKYYRKYVDPFHYGGWHSFILLDVRPQRLEAEKVAMKEVQK